MSDPIHVVILRTDATHQSKVVGSASVEWRKVLQNGNLSAAVEIKDVLNRDVSAGVLDIHVQLLPIQTYGFMSFDEIHSQVFELSYSLDES